jgi:hypothetical protein
MLLPLSQRDLPERSGGDSSMAPVGGMGVAAGPSLAPTRRSMDVPAPAASTPAPTRHSIDLPLHRSPSNIMHMGVNRMGGPASAHGLSAMQPSGYAGAGGQGRPTSMPEMVALPPRASVPPRLSPLTASGSSVTSDTTPPVSLSAPQTNGGGDEAMGGLGVARAAWAPPPDLFAFTQQQELPAPGGVCFSRLGLSCSLTAEGVPPVGGAQGVPQSQPRALSASAVDMPNLGYNGSWPSAQQQQQMGSGTFPVAGALDSPAFMFGPTVASQQAQAQPGGFTHVMQRQLTPQAAQQAFGTVMPQPGGFMNALGGMTFAQQAQASAQQQLMLKQEQVVAEQGDVLMATAPPSRQGTSGLLHVPSSAWLGSLDGSLGAGLPRPEDLPDDFLLDELSPFVSRDL